MTARVAIVGGGFTGAVTAVQLARAASRPLWIDIIEPRPLLGGGVAYSATDPSHRINVPASRMTVFAEDPTQFDRWLREHGTLEADPQALWGRADAFPQRAVFGRYIAELVSDASRDRPQVQIRHRQTMVHGVLARQNGFSLRLADGEALQADMVVLAVSHPPPAVPVALRAAQAAGARIVADPWAPGSLEQIPPDADVLIVGTGLTMADVTASLERLGHRGHIVALSRRGLLSRGHPAAPATWSAFKTLPPPATARGLARAVRQQVRLAHEQGIHWQAVFDDVRSNGGRLWSALPDAEKRRLARHLRPFWDVHRFRVAPQVEAAIKRLRDEGRLTIHAASLLDARCDGASITVRIMPRHARGHAPVVLRVGAIVVTTGPAHAGILASNPALASLAEQGLLQLDGSALGLLVDSQSHAIGRDGTARPDLFIAGPLARGRFGELMGLPQVSEHAAAVARTVELACAS
jgi:uncharacterized NAD(P)/FAD-binding protein YdhS